MTRLIRNKIARYVTASALVTTVPASALTIATLLAIATLTSACDVEDEDGTVPDRLDELDELVDNDAFGSLAAPPSPDAGMACEGSYTSDQVWAACGAAYENGVQIGACYNNICSCYKCQEQ